MTKTKSIEWAAGLFEGEGCISVLIDGSSRRQPTGRLTLSSTDRDTVDNFYAAVGRKGRLEVQQPRNHRRKIAYRWQCTKKDDIEEILIKLYPHLGERRKAKANEIKPLLQYKRRRFI